MPRIAYGEPQVKTSPNNEKRNSLRYRYYYGVRFIFGSSLMSQYGSVNLGEALTSLAVIQVYAALAVTLVTVFALAALGNLSKNYKKAATTKMDYNAEASYVVPTKMLVALGSYYGLCQMFEKVKTISDARHAEAKAERDAQIVDVGDIDLKEKDATNGAVDSKDAKEGEHTAAPGGMRTSAKQPGQDDEHEDIHRPSAPAPAGEHEGMPAPAPTATSKSMQVKTDAEELKEHRLSIIEEMFGGNDMDPSLTKAVVHAGLDRLFCDGEVTLDPWEVDELTDRYFEYLGDPDDVSITRDIANNSNDLNNLNNLNNLNLIYC